ncbi:MAG: hypothetical protein RMK19_00550 [Bacteroidia bacterium]|nr:hypothetical protein [Bacteroidia bacterium]MDW8014486.1 hypothetical protein [Bacteroidia bacterium]
MEGCYSDSGSPHLIPPEKQPAFLLDSIRRRLYPLVAGAHAPRDSIKSYRWELWHPVGETIYFGLSRPARSLYRDRREAVLGRFVLKDTGLAYYEEIGWTYRFRGDTIRRVIEGVFRAWQNGTPIESLQEAYLSFPDPYSFYDIKQRCWKRVIGRDTVESLQQLLEQKIP